MTSHKLLSLVQKQRTLPKLNNFTLPQRAINILYNNMSTTTSTSTSNNTTQSNNNNNAAAQQHTFNTSLLDHIACPLCKQRLTYNESTNELYSDCTEDVTVAYPIHNGM